MIMGAPPCPRETRRRHGVELDRLDDPVEAQGPDEVLPLHRRHGGGSRRHAVLAPRARGQAGDQDRNDEEAAPKGAQFFEQTVLSIPAGKRLVI